MAGRAIPEWLHEAPAARRTFLRAVLNSRSLRIIPPFEVHSSRNVFDVLVRYAWSIGRMGRNQGATP